MIEEFTEELVKEWSWRLDDGIPDTDDPEKVDALREVLIEKYEVPSHVVEDQVRALLSEADFPTKTDFEEDMEDALEEGGFLTGDRASTSRVVYVQEAGNPEFLRELRDFVEEYFSEHYEDVNAELYTTSGSQLDGSRSNYPDGVTATTSSDSYMTLWVELMEDGDVKGYDFKLSGQGGSPSADDYEAGIAIAYNLAQGQSKNEAIENANLEPVEVQGIYETIVDAGNRVIEDLPDMGSDMKQLGASGQFSVSDKWPAKRNVPKTDMISGDEFRISLKKSGRSQLMSGGPNESKGVFKAAKEYFENQDEQEKSAVADEVLDIVENKFSKFETDLNISTIKSKLADFWEEKREGEITSLSGNALEDHITAELRLFNLRARRGNWREDLDEDIAPTPDEFVSWVEEQVRENDDITDVFLKTVEGSINHREIQTRFSELFEGNPEFLKWCVFEAASGVYKFTGEPDPGAFSPAAANKVLVFDPFDGVLRWQDIDTEWARRYSGKVNVETSFKGKTRRYTSFRMATITESEEPAPPYLRGLSTIIEQEVQRAADELSVMREEFLLKEDVMDYVRKTGEGIKKIARKVFEFIQQTVMSAAQRIVERFMEFAREAAEQGLDALMKFFGYEIEGTAQVDVQL